MIVSYSKNPFYQFVGILVNNKWRFLFFISCALVAHITHNVLGFTEVKLDALPVTILGSALAIFLGFRNSSAYDRWWEARKVWGEVVNNSRTLALQIKTYSSSKTEEESLSTWQKEMLYRHLGWVYALKSHLIKSDIAEQLKQWMPPAEQIELDGKSNIPTQIINIQGKQLKHALEKGWIEDFRLYELMSTLSACIDSQGKCERIKNTIFPFYYNYFTRVFLWLFIMCLPFAFVDVMGWVSIPISVGISFVFNILDKSGVITEEPFEGRAADTPMKTIARSIEIDFKEMLEEENIPEPVAVSKGAFGVRYRQ